VKKEASRRADQGPRDQAQPSALERLSAARRENDGSAGALPPSDGRGCKCGAVSPWDHANCIRCGGRLAGAPAKVPPTPRIRIVGFISQKAYDRLNMIRSVNTWQISNTLEFVLNEYWKNHKDEILPEVPDADEERRG
jgi:hypothetical protein